MTESIGWLFSMILCSKCKTESQGVLLRTGETVCGRCLLNEELMILKINEATNLLKLKKPPLNFWDYLFKLTFLFLGIATIILLFINIMVAFGCLVLCIFITQELQNKSAKVNGPFRKNIESQINSLIYKRETLKNSLSKIYEHFWDLPPDWEWRRQQIIKITGGKCQACNRRRSGSVVPFHVHHKIPKSKKDGNHSLDNLQLLCEICHSKMLSNGHELVMESRRTRLKTKKYKIRTGVSPFSVRISKFSSSDIARYKNLETYLLNKNTLLV